VHHENESTRQSPLPQSFARARRHRSRVSGGSAPETVREAPGQGSLSRLPYMTASQEKNGRRNRILPPGWSLGFGSENFSKAVKST